MYTDFHNNCIIITLIAWNLYFANQRIPFP